MSLSGKRIVVGITGGIAAYKTIEFIRLLRKSNAEVRVALTPAAAEFVTPLTLQAISGNAVSQSLLDPQAELAMGHIAPTRLSSVASQSQLHGSTVALSMVPSTSWLGVHRRQVKPSAHGRVVMFAAMLSGSSPVP